MASGKKGVRGCRGGARGRARSARLWRASRSAAGGGDSAASNLQIKGGKGVKGRRQVRLRGYTSGRGAGEARVEVGAPIDRACDEKS